MRRTMKTPAKFALALLLGWPLLPAIDATARDKAIKNSGVVKACSRYGNGCVSGAVRPAKWGHEVQLKSGTWIDCRQDCGRALLEETIDFWDSQADKARVAAP